MAGPDNKFAGPLVVSNADDTTGFGAGDHRMFWYEGDPNGVALLGLLPAGSVAIDYDTPTIWYKNAASPDTVWNQLQVA